MKWIGPCDVYQCMWEASFVSAWKPVYLCEVLLAMPPEEYMQMMFSHPNMNLETVHNHELSGICNLGIIIGYVGAIAPL